MRGEDKQKKQDENEKEEKDKKKEQDSKGKRGVNVMRRAEKEEAKVEVETRKGVGVGVGVEVVYGSPFAADVRSTAYKSQLLNRVLRAMEGNTANINSNVTTNNGSNSNSSKYNINNNSNNSSSIRTSKRLSPPSLPLLPPALILMHTSSLQLDECFYGIVCYTLLFSFLYFSIYCTFHYYTVLFARFICPLACVADIIYA